WATANRDGMQDRSKAGIQGEPCQMTGIVERRKFWGDIHNRDAIAAIVADDGDGSKASKFKLIRDCHGRWLCGGIVVRILTNLREIHGFNNEEVGRVGLNATADDVEGKPMRKREEGRRDGDVNFTIADRGWSRDCSAVETNNCT